MAHGASMTPDELRKKNKRLGWILALVAFALFVAIIVRSGIH